MTEITREEARHLALAAQGLFEEPDQAATKPDVLDMVRRLGCVQIDTISVVARSHYLVLWSRLGQYDPAWLDQLLYPDRSVFEYWGHAASIIPANLFPYFRRRMQQYADNGSSGNLDWRQENVELLNDVREAVRLHGPISSKHFERQDTSAPVPAWAWWGGKPSNRALDSLWSSGELMIDRRVNFQRFYDLAERVLPDHYHAPLPDLDEERRVLALNAVRAMGVAQPAWLNDYFRTKWGGRAAPSPAPVQILAELAERGEIMPVTIDGLGAGYVATEHQETLDDIRHGSRSTRVSLLSPFDNLIWDRKRTLSLFDFDYRLECYTPAAKRIYGYFTLPILFHGELVGRLEPKVDRKRKLFTVRALHLEPGVEIHSDLAEGILTALQRFAKFNGASDMVIESAPEGLKQCFASSGWPG